MGLFCIKNVITFLIWSNSSEKNPILQFYLISKKIGLFSEPFDQIKKVMTFLMQNRPMAYNIY